MMLGGLSGRLCALLCFVGLTGCGGPSEQGSAEQPEQGASAAQALAVAPTISSFSPAKALPGATVTINGRAFVSGASVSFNGTPASSVTFSSTTRLKAVVPDGATSGPISVTVPAGTAESATSFLVLPKVTNVDPPHAFVGGFVTVSGSGFTGATGVKLGSLSASFAVLSDTSISAAVPAGFVSGKVTVTTPAGSAASSTAVLSLPLLSSFAPAQGLVGSSVDLVGEGFSQATAVKLGSKAASFEIASDTLIHALVPAGVSSGKFTVETPLGNRSSATSFAVILKPTVSSFTPASSELPITLTVNGSNFVGVSAVRVGAVGVPFSVVSTKQLTATLSLGTPSGKISVVNPAGTAISAATFVSIACSDVDADGVCDRDDICPGFDDRVDSDADATPDGCDACPSAASAGQSCGAGFLCDAAGACGEVECNESVQGPGVLRGNVSIDSIDTAGDLARLAGIWCVTGDVTVSRTELTDLSALSSLVEVGGNLGIGTYPADCSGCGLLGNGQLRSLHGLEQLRRVGRWLEVLDQAPDPGVTDLTGLSGLRQAGGLMIVSPVQLVDLHGLERLTRLDSLYVENAGQLTSLNGLQNLSSVGDVRLVGDPLLTDLTPLSKLTSLVSLQIIQTGITSLHGLEDLSALSYLTLASNPNLANLDALSNLRALTMLSLGDLPIASLSVFSQARGISALGLYGLNNVTTLDGVTIEGAWNELSISRLPQLTSLSALGSPSIAYVQLNDNVALQDCGTWAPAPGAWVTISQSPALTSLECLQGATSVQRLTLEALGVVNLHGLENLTDVQVLALYQNPALSSLHELSSLTEVYWPSIRGNSSLSQCEIDWLGTQLGFYISDNFDNGPACEP